MFPSPLFFVVCSVFLNSELQFQVVQDENDCREINIKKTNQKRRRVVRATISRVLARLQSATQPFLVSFLALRDDSKNGCVAD